MSDGEFYRPVDELVCQGDLFDGIPSLHLKYPVNALRPFTGKGGKQNLEQYALPQSGSSSQPLPSGMNPKLGLQVSAFCQTTRGILLSHGCDIDKDEHHRLVAIVRPMESILDEADRETVRSGKRLAFFHLPAALGLGLAESYVDFRRITCLQGKVLAGGMRLASLSGESVNALMGRLMTFFSRREVDFSKLGPESTR